jgi:hypothetical protein
MQPAVGWHVPAPFRAGECVKDSGHVVIEHNNLKVFVVPGHPVQKEIECPAACRRPSDRPLAGRGDALKASSRLVGRPRLPGNIVVERDRVAGWAGCCVRHSPILSVRAFTRFGSPA